MMALIGNPPKKATRRPHVGAQKTIVNRDKYRALLSVGAVSLLFDISNVSSTIAQRLRPELAIGSWRMEFGFNDERRTPV